MLLFFFGLWVGAPIGFFVAGLLAMNRTQQMVEDAYNAGVEFALDPWGGEQA